MIGALAGLALLMGACARQLSDPTVVFRQGGCTYSGPEEVPRRFTLRWTLEETGPETPILAVVVIDSGKTVEDLADLPAEDPPPSWLTKLTYATASRPGSYTKDVDLSSNAAYRGGPIYSVCFSADEDTAQGALGPFQITD